MKIGVLGTGVVGRSLASGWLSAGHQVALGSRTSDNKVAVGWVANSGGHASNGTFRDAVAHGEVIVNCTPGDVSLAILADVGTEAIGESVLLDVANPLDFSGGFPPRLAIVNDDSLGESIQRQLPRARVVKALNTVTASVMVDPARLSGRHDLFMAGDDEGAKACVRSLLADLGWATDDVHDLGGITAARASEMYLPLWLRLMGSLGGAEFNVHVVRPAAPTG